MAGTRPGGRPASAVRWRREASTDHSHEGGADTVDAFPFTLQDHGPRRPRRVATTYGAWQHPANCETRENLCVPRTPSLSLSSRFPEADLNIAVSTRASMIARCCPRTGLLILIRQLGW